MELQTLHSKRALGTFITVLLLAGITGCAKTNITPENDPNRYVVEYKALTECPKPDRPSLKVMYEESLLSSRNLLVSRQNESTLMNYAIGLENTVVCYESQVLSTGKSEGVNGGRSVRVKDESTIGNKVINNLTEDKEKKDD